MNSLITKRIVPTFQQSVRRLAFNAPAGDAPKVRVPDSGKCVNKVTLMGRCAADARLYPLNDREFAAFTLATNSVRKNRQGELIQRADFHKILVYPPGLAKKCGDLVTKGTRVYIEGELNYRKTENHLYSNVVADKVIFLSGTNQAADQAEDIEAHGEAIPEDFEAEAMEAEQK